MYCEAAAGGLYREALRRAGLTVNVWAGASGGKDMQGIHAPDAVRVKGICQPSSIVHAGDYDCTAEKPPSSSRTRMNPPAAFIKASALLIRAAGGVSGSLIMLLSVAFASTMLAILGAAAASCSALILRRMLASVSNRDAQAAAVRLFLG